MPPPPPARVPPNKSGEKSAPKLPGSKPPPPSSETADSSTQPAANEPTGTTSSAETTETGQAAPPPPTTPPKTPSKAPPKPPAKNTADPSVAPKTPAKGPPKPPGKKTVPDNASSEPPSNAQNESSSAGATEQPATSTAPQSPSKAPPKPPGKKTALQSEQTAPSNEPSTTDGASTPPAGTPAKAPPKPPAKKTAPQSEQTAPSNEASTTDGASTPPTGTPANASAQKTAPESEQTAPSNEPSTTEESTTNENAANDAAETGATTVTNEPQNPPPKTPPAISPPPKTPPATSPPPKAPPASAPPLKPASKAPSSASQTPVSGQAKQPQEPTQQPPPRKQTPAQETNQQEKAEHHTTPNVSRPITPASKNAPPPKPTPKMQSPEPDQPISQTHPFAPSELTVSLYLTIEGTQYTPYSKWDITKKHQFLEAAKFDLWKCVSRYCEIPDIWVGTQAAVNDCIRLDCVVRTQSAQMNNVTEALVAYVQSAQPFPTATQTYSAIEGKDKNEVALADGGCGVNHVPVQRTTTSTQEQNRSSEQDKPSKTVVEQVRSYFDKGEKNAPSQSVASNTSASEEAMQHHSQRRILMTPDRVAFEHYRHSVAAEWQPQVPHNARTSDLLISGGRLPYTSKRQAPVYNIPVSGSVQTPSREAFYSESQSGYAPQQYYETRQPEVFNTTPRHLRYLGPQPDHYSYFGPPQQSEPYYPSYHDRPLEQQREYPTHYPPYQEQYGYHPESHEQVRSQRSTTSYQEEAPKPNELPFYPKSSAPYQKDLYEPRVDPNVWENSLRPDPVDTYNYQPRSTSSTSFGTRRMQSPDWGNEVSYRTQQYDVNPVASKQNAPRSATPRSLREEPPTSHSNY